MAYGNSIVDMDTLVTMDRLMRSMKETISYSAYDTLMSVDQVEKKKHASCHDIVFYEMEKLKLLHPKALFFAEVNLETKAAGMCHSLVYVEDPAYHKIIWFEYIWPPYQGLHIYDTLADMLSQLQGFHEHGWFGDAINYPELEFHELGDHKPGETLEEFISICRNMPEVEC